MKEERVTEREWKREGEREKTVQSEYKIVECDLTVIYHGVILTHRISYIMIP